MTTTILAIESSCDETAVAILRYDGEHSHILSSEISSQIDIHREFGGVVPELASRAHQKSIIPVVTEALQKANINKNEVINFLYIFSRIGFIFAMLVNGI